MISLKNIMLIDDDPDDQEIFSDALKNVGPTIEASIFNNAIEALKYLETTGILPDCIFLDLNLPMMNGKQFLELIKKSEKLKNIPVIIYSTSKYDPDVNETFSLQAEMFIQKPSLFHEICEILREALLTVGNLSDRKI
jgi:CheY-like chemotaxis protein